jgi:hypothetical protein
MSNFVADHVARDWKVSLVAFVIGGAITSLLGNFGIFLAPFMVGMYISYERMHHHPWPLEDRITAILFVSLGCAFGIHFWQRELFQSATEQYWWWLYGVTGKALFSGILGMFAMKYGTLARKKWRAN